MTPPREASTEPSTTRAPLRYWSPWLAVFVLAWLVTYVAVAPHPVALAQQNGFLVAVGVVGAFIGNVTAVGGGLVFIPVTIFLLHVPPVQALKLAILSQCFGMTSGAIAWSARGMVPRKLFLAATPGLLLGSTVSTLVIRPSALLVKGLFGPVSVLIGIVLLATRNRAGTRDSLPTSIIPALVAVSFVGGLITGWVAIGEGELVAAFLMIAYGLRSNRAIGLGVALLSLNSLYLAALHHHFMGGLPWAMGAFTGLGCVFGARLGPFASQWVSPKVLKVAFAVIAITDGLLFIAQFVAHRGHP